MKTGDAALQLADRDAGDRAAGARIGERHAGNGEFADLRLVAVLGEDALEHLRMAQRDRAAADVVADLDREVKQADQVGDGRAVLLADAARDLVVGEVEARLQRLVALGLLDGVEVVALEVLGDRHDRGGRVVDLAQHDGDELESGLDGGALAAFAADEFELAVGTAAAGEGLDDAVLADGLHEIVQLLAAELRTRLERAAFDVLRRDLEDLLRLGHGLGNRRGGGGRDRRNGGGGSGRRQGGGRRDEVIQSATEATADVAESTMLLLRLHRGARRGLGARGLLEERVGVGRGFLRRTHVYIIP